MDNLNLPIQTSQPVQEPNKPAANPNNRVEPRDDRDKFSKVVKKDRSKDEEEEAGVGIISLKDDEDSTNIFALSRHLSPKKKKESSSETPSTGHTHPDLAGVGTGEGDTAGLTDTDEDGKNKQGNNASDFSQDSRQDLFQNVSTPPTQGPTTVFDPGKTSADTAVARKEVFELMQQIVDKMTQTTTQGVTSTEITFKFPPLFEGAKVTIKEMDQAKGQFNLTFENLSVQAKNIIDLTSSRDLLKHNLEIKGYMVHIITTNVSIEQPTAKQFASGDDSRERDSQGKGQGQGQQQQQQRQPRG